MEKNLAFVFPLHRASKRIITIQTIHPSQMGAVKLA